MKTCLKLCASVLPALLMVACGSFPLSPVSEQGRSLRQPAGAYRVVQPGDTLYSIAWESGRDYQDVARWNRIPPPYVIKPGQRLQLFPPSGTEPAPRPAPPPPPRVDVQKKPPPAKPAPRVPAVAARRLSWTWPAQGELLERFSANGPNKGVDIAGKTGQPILAAEAGQVVYQGGGLRGYGQLIIIKHDEDFLSAYAHCDKIYVREGNVIKRGQKIADMGSSGTDRAKLHFEVRYRGAPVDPLDYLPKK
ncbi:peptidase M23 [Sulfuricaulis limicola]|uniref:Peptidase M23 n=1 Tax=Sulfuricaulis limicola TaxID=1620215 RepID=A0A1B4XG88_9GAMM|nr:peptidoglycan DD-metalloendopeptidase family protein [Sulfuricaulis limicola]BAV33799.1 peptidase M23 [Sulfuricaulis limicola]